MTWKDIKYFGSIKNIKKLLNLPCDFPLKNINILFKKLWLFIFMKENIKIKFKKNIYDEKLLNPMSFSTVPGKMFSWFSLKLPQKIQEMSFNDAKNNNNNTNKLLFHM